jgi:hypothetical protein
MDYPQLKNTVFGEVFAEMLEARGLPVTPFEVGKLAEDAGLDGWKVLDRMAASAGAGYAGPLDGLVAALDLTKPETKDLAHAFTFEERRKAGRIPEILSKVNGCLGEAIDRLADVPPETFGGEDDYYKAKGAIAEGGQLVARAQRRLAERSRPAG